MRDGAEYAAELLDLRGASDDKARRMLFRQALAALARGGEGPATLASLDGEALRDAVQFAFDRQLFDDLEWLGPEAAGLALYELAAILPHGVEQRELGRRLLGRLYGANAVSFAAIAARMASGSTRALLSPAVRARIALCVEVPLAEGVPDGPLAHAILSRRELSRVWVEQASTSSLPQRRLAARLLERAAREATFRASQEDRGALRVFAQEPIVVSLARLLADREPLVWRYAATARGLLAPYIENFARALEAAVDPNLTPTEWRRMATSVVALTATDPHVAQQYLARMIPLFERDRGMAGALVWGLPRAAEAEEGLAERWLDLALSIDPFASAEAMCDFLVDYGHESFTEPAVNKTLIAVERLAASSAKKDLADALLKEFQRDLGDLARPAGTLRAELGEALDTFAREGAPAAFAAARSVVESAAATVAVLTAGAGQREGASQRGLELEMRATANVLRDVGTSLLERNVIADLARLGSNPGEVRALRERLDGARAELTEWLLSEEQSNDVVNVAVSLRRVKALLHVADGDGDEEERGSSSPEDINERSSRSARRAQRWMRIAETFLRRTRGEPPQQLRRVLLAGLARACDGYVRDDAGDLVEVFLALTASLDDPLVFDTLASASTTPDLVYVLHGYAQLLRVIREAMPEPSAAAVRQDSLMPPAITLIAIEQLHTWLGELEQLTITHIASLSQRSHALQQLLARVHVSLRALLSVQSLADLHADPSPVIDLEAALSGLQKLTAPALRRFGIDGDVLGTPARRPFGRTSDRPARTSDPSGPSPLSALLARGGALRDDQVHAASNAIGRGIPRALAAVIGSVYARLLTLRAAKERHSGRFQGLAPLPAWVPARRTLGGFYLLRALGAGGAGSVFLVCRIEDRYEHEPERFALKVPQYSETAARTLSEAEFLQMFRDEASALLALPTQSNLAKFVTFDVGARPKPILVMEYVEGKTAEHLLETKSLDLRAALKIAGELLAGLEAMHAVGLAHLDVKPSNLILRTGTLETVLVDFGLSGRTLRPGCATGAYGAPEVWTATPADAATQKASAVDVYAAAAVIFELCTGEMLFEASSELELVSKHIAHDGVPSQLARLSRAPRMQELAELLCSALRRDPARRISASEMRSALVRMSKKIEAESWPIVLPP